MTGMKRTGTYMAKSPDLQASWQVVDAADQILGRMASRIAMVLQGKTKPMYTAHQLTGDYVVVINASKVRTTGRKLSQKTYYRHSGYTGNLKSTLLQDMLAQHPERVIQLAVKGMLPTNKRGRDMMRRLKVYAGNTHPHQGQAEQKQQREDQ
jgi:large subunit ribosomal protein L13